jgi:hypothetical protein
MSGTMRLLATVAGVLFIVFAVVVAVYAGEPFNIATLFGIVGVAMLAKPHWKRPAEA